MFAFSDSRPPVPEALVSQLRPVSLANTRTLPLVPLWRDLLPQGLRRGSTVVVQAAPGQGGLSLSLSLLSAATAQGHWVSVVGVDDPGVVAMADLGIDLRRVLFVPRARGAWAEATADLLDGVDLVVVRPPARAPHAAARKLTDRVRERGSVLIVLSEPTAQWPLPGDVQIQVREAKWATSSRLRARTLQVHIGGRGSMGVGTNHTVLLPSARGCAEAS